MAGLTWAFNTWLNGCGFASEIGDERLDVVLTRLDADVAAHEELPREVRFVPHGARAEEIVQVLKE